MIKKYLLIPLSLLALVSCQHVQVTPRPTLPMVYSIAADTAGVGRLVAQSGQRGGEGSIAIIGEPRNVISLARRFQGCDRVDNVDGRAVRDSLPDFAGETFDAIMDARFAPYSHFQDTDSLRDAAVINAVSAWDSLAWRSASDLEPRLRKARSKLLIYTSSLQAQWGLFDVDTLQQMCGGNCRVISPVHAMLDEAYAAGARSIAVWTSHEVSSRGAWEAVFAQKGWADAHLSVLVPESAVDVRTQLRSLLRQYRQTGRELDAILVDDYYVDLTLLRSELKLMQMDIPIWDPINSIIRVTYDTMREHHMFTHRITRPVVHYYETAESAEGKPRLKYVPNLD